MKKPILKIYQKKKKKKKTNQDTPPKKGIRYDQTS